MFHEILAVIHIFICLGVIVLVLIQHGKGADAGAAFGSGASATVFGSQGSASFLTRTTAIFATVFFLTSLTLAYFSRQPVEAESVVTQEIPIETKIESEIPTVDTPATVNQEELTQPPETAPTTEEQEFATDKEAAIDPNQKMTLDLKEEKVDNNTVIEIPVEDASGVPQPAPK